MNAELSGKLTQTQRDALEKLSASPDEETLWAALKAFRDTPFRTMSGLEFSYTLKTGRNGEYTRELFVDRRQGSKSLAFGSVRAAFAAALRMRGQVIDRPKALGDIRGVSYIYPLFWRFGLIEVPEKAAEMMRTDETAPAGDEPRQLSFFE